MAFDKFKQKIRSSILSGDYVSVEELKDLESTIDSQQKLLDNLFTLNKLEPNIFLMNMHRLSYELLKFIDNVCIKHNIEYWMDYGTLLGAIRHKDFIPWDDDLDLGIMRQDYERLIEIMPQEIEENKLKNVVARFKIDKHNHKSKRWYQVSCKHPHKNSKLIGADFFPYDYMKGYEGDLVKDFNDAMTEYYHNPDKYTLEEFREKFNRQFNVTSECQNQLIAGIDNVRGNISLYTLYRTISMKTEEVFPLQRLPFGECELLAPNDSIAYVKHIYGENYINIPEKIRDHGRLNKFRRQEDIIEILEEGILILKEANDNF